MSVILFEVRGKPVTQGSMRAYLPKGSRFPVVTHANPKTAEWRNLVAMEARRVAPATPWLGPVKITLVFRLQRPKGHYHPKSGELRADAARHPSSPPDASKLLRAVEDALTGLIYRDDAQIVHAVVWKQYGIPGVEVEVRELGTP